MTPVWESASVTASRSRPSGARAATVDAARALDVPALITITRSGFSARLVSSYRPSAPIFAICTDAITFSQLAAVWGVKPVLATEEDVSYESLTDFGKRSVVEAGLGRAGEHGRDGETGEGTGSQPWDLPLDNRPPDRVMVGTPKEGSAEPLD